MEATLNKIEDKAQSNNFWAIVYRLKVCWSVLTSKHFMFMDFNLENKDNIEITGERFRVDFKGTGKALILLGKEFDDFDKYCQAVENLKF
jgi:hypothetical protein